MIAHYWVHLKTDDRVHDVVKYFRDADRWVVDHEIDSANFGEGYDLLWENIPVCLHDDQRSDEVYSRYKGPSSLEKLEHHFKQVAEEMAGQVTLGFAVDYWNKADPQRYPEAIEAIKRTLLEAGYSSECISIDSFTPEGANG